MKAYVLNHDEIKQYILIIVLALIVSFSLGFYLGGRDSGALNEGADLSVAESSDAIDIKPDSNMSSETLAAESENSKLITQDKADIKDKKPEVKKPEPVKKPVEKKKVEKKIVENKKPAKKETIKDEVAKTVAEKTVVKKEAVTENKPQTTQAKIIAQQPDKPDTKKSVTNQGAEVSSSQNDAADNSAKPVITIKSDQRIYSIQVGMFASKSNAESFIEKLTEKDFDAYVSDFVSSSGTTKYNVRIGQFEQRDQARDLLKEFKKSFSSPAYVVIAQ